MKNLPHPFTTNKCLPPHLHFLPFTIAMNIWQTCICFLLFFSTWLQTLKMCTVSFLLPPARQHQLTRFIYRMDDYLFEILVTQIQSGPLYFTNCEKFSKWLNFFLSLPNSEMEVLGSYCETLKERFNGSGFYQLAFIKCLLILDVNLIHKASF